MSRAQPQDREHITGITRLTLTDFRCYTFLRMDTDLRPVVLVGPNGAGKTNVLEALSFLAPGRGLRRARLSEIARREAGADTPWAVAAQAHGCGGVAVDLGTGRDQGSERRLVRIDGRPAKSQTQLAEVLGVLWLTPAMDRLFLEGAAGRRRFLDRLVLGLDPLHGRRAAAYDHALRERARLLKAGGADPAWLAVLEEAMARHGVEMAAARRSALARLDAAARAGLGPFPAAGLSVAGTVEDWLGTMTEAQAMQRLAALLAQSRRRDGDSGGAADGPHRSDFVVRHLARDLAAEHCSTGEQKALLIAIVLAQARVQAELRGMAPILLLDEVAAHLDARRRDALFDELCALGAQSWLTGTDDVLFAGLGRRAQFYRVDDSRISALQAA